MKFSLPGQLKGPECKNVITQSIYIRKKLEMVFLGMKFNLVNEISIILRIDGSLGSFGTEGIENFRLANGICTCDVVIKNLDWGNLTNEKITEILKLRIHSAIVYCFESLNINIDMARVNDALR